jgi:hypothetical protein
MNIESEPSTEAQSYHNYDYSYLNSPAHTINHEYYTNQLIERTQYFNLDSLVPEFQSCSISSTNNDFQPQHDRNQANPELCVSFDIYGNEIIIENRNLSFQDRDIYRESDNEPKVNNNENNDPIYNMITPMKRRNESRSDSRRSSFGISRSPLFDITPPMPKKKSMLQEVKVEVKYSL